MNLDRIIFILLAASLGACNPSLAGSPTDSSKGITNYHPVGKPHAPVEMNYDLPEKIKSGQQTTIVLNLYVTRDVENLSAQIRVDEGLNLESAAQAGWGVTPRGKHNELAVKFMPLRNGMFYIHVTMALQFGGQQQSRSFTIPVNVGNVDVQKQLKSSGVVSEDASGERVISMPAQESFGPAKKH